MIVLGGYPWKIKEQEVPDDEKCVEKRENYTRNVVDHVSVHGVLGEVDFSVNFEQD